MKNKTKKIVILILPLVFLVFWESCGGSSSGPEEPEYTTQAWERFQKEDYDSALTLFEKSLENNSSTEGAVGKGWSLLMLDTTSLGEVGNQLEKGTTDGKWEYDSRVGLASVKLSQGEYDNTLTHVNTVLKDSSSYVFKYNSDINWHDLLIIKSQALYLGDRDYKAAYNTIEKVDPDSSYNLNPDDPETWMIDGEEYQSFNTIVAEIITLESSKYKSF